MLSMHSKCITMCLALDKQFMVEHYARTLDHGGQEKNEIEINSMTKKKRQNCYKKMKRMPEMKL